MFLYAYDLQRVDNPEGNFHFSKEYIIEHDVLFLISNYFRIDSFTTEALSMVVSAMISL